MPEKIRKKSDDILKVCLQNIKNTDVMQSVEYEPAGGRISMSGAWGRAEYRTYIKERLSNEMLSLLIHHAKSLDTGAKPLLLSDYINLNIANVLHRNGMEFVDMAGNMFLKQSPLYMPN